MDMTQDLIAFAQSPAGVSVLTLFRDKALDRAAIVVDAFRRSEEAQTPRPSTEQMIDEIEGDVWHYLRRKWGVFGVLVDALRRNPEYAEPLRAFIRSRLEPIQAPPVTAPISPAAPAAPRPVITVLEGNPN